VGLVSVLFSSVDKIIDGPMALALRLKPAGGSRSRDYIFCAKGLVGTEVGIGDGKQVGSVATGFYFFQKTAGTVPHSLRQSDHDGL
jgi:hypothetical protein